MKNRESRGRFGLLSAALVCLLLGLVAVTQASAAEEPPYEFSAELSLTGGCGTLKADPIPDPGCPERKPPQPFTSPRAIAIDSNGDEYVASYGAEEGKQGRIDVFNPEGIFITEVKDERGPKNVAIDSKGVLYTFDKRFGQNAEFARYKPIVYKLDEEKIEYGPRELIAEKTGPQEGGMAIDSNDHIFVDWPTIGIIEYGSSAEGNELKSTFSNSKLQSSVFIALDKLRRRLYSSSCPNGNLGECWVLVFDADTHELLEEVEGPNPPEEKFLSTKGWISIAVNEETGDFFVGDLEVTKNIYQFNEKYKSVSTLKQDPALFEGGEAMQIALSNAKGAFNHEYLFVPSLKNRALAYSPPVEQPARVLNSVTGIGEEEAELLATIEPRGGETTYVFEYLSQQEYEEAGNSFEGAKVAGEGTIQPAEQEAEVSAPINGLSPETEYRFRVSAENEVGGEVKDATFTTYSDAGITAACPEAIRITDSTLLPDCRAYELVTPADTNGRPARGVGFGGDPFNTLEASPGGKTVSFLTEGGVIPGLGGAGGLNGDLYRTTRTAGGWHAVGAGASGEESTSPNPGSTSPDQGYSFWQAGGEGSAVVEGEATHYVRYPDGHSALVGRGSLGADPRSTGKLITEEGTDIVFQTRTINGKQPVQLEPDAPPVGTKAVYDRTPDEVTHVVSLLPGDETPKAGENAEYVGAALDGEGIAFSIGTTLYLRVGNETTYEIGEEVEFAGVSEEGKRAFYLEGGDLFAFDVESEEAIRFSETGNAIPINISSDGTRAYLVSTTAIAGSGENPNGASPQVGQQNLYLSEEGTIRFVATVTKRDVGGEATGNGQLDGLGLWTSSVGSGELAKDPSRANPDGTVLLFSSRAVLGSYDPEGAPEIYRYDSVGNRLHCISCVPTKTPPAGGGASLESVDVNQGDPPPFSTFGFVPNLRADGKRVIFQSTEALVSRDNDVVQDVYEWEEEGVGSCTRPGGCVYLISSGRSAADNYLYGISASDDDVFFTTADVLTGADDNTVSIYDARVNGGFEEKPCQGPGECTEPPLTPPPLLPVPESEGTAAAPPVPSKHCPKGKHRAPRHGKKVCVKNKKHRNHRKHKHGEKGVSK